MSGQNTPIDRERITITRGRSPGRRRRATARRRTLSVGDGLIGERHYRSPLLVAPSFLIFEMIVTAPGTAIAVMTAVRTRDEDGLLTLVLGRDKSRDGAEHGTKYAERNSLIAVPPSGGRRLHAYRSEGDERRGRGRDSAICHGYAWFASIGFSRSHRRGHCSIYIYGVALMRQRGLYFCNVAQKPFRNEGYTNIQKAV